MTSMRRAGRRASRAVPTTGRDVTRGLSPPQAGGRLREVGCGHDRTGTAGRRVLSPVPPAERRRSAMTIISGPQQFNEDELYVDLRSIVGHDLFLKCEGFNFAGSVKLK